MLVGRDEGAYSSNGRSKAEPDVSDRGWINLAGVNEDDDVREVDEKPTVDD